jgi:hypothetical protein
MHLPRLAILYNFMQISNLCKSGNFIEMPGRLVPKEAQKAAIQVDLAERLKVEQASEYRVPKSGV